METTIRRIGSSLDLLGESPCWDGDTSTLWWIDALAGLVRALDVDAGGEPVDVHPLPAPLGAIALCASGGLVVALRHGFGRYDPVGRSLVAVAPIDVEQDDVRLNDGKCDPWGNFIAGTLQMDRRPGDPVNGGLYRLRPDGRVEVLARGFGLVNGPCFSPDGRKLYVADSSLGARTIWAYDYAPDQPLSNRRMFVQTHGHGAGPDGAAVDTQGYVWSALPRVGHLARFDPDGRLDRLLRMPATHPTSLCFGGPAMDRLYVTSISRSTNLTGPLADDGGLWEVRGLPAPGVAVGRFGG